METEEIQRLIRHAAEARRHAYAPYSRFPVGAAVLTADGRIFTGCNVENTSYPAGLCAERNAVGSAVAAGVTVFRAMALCGSTEDYTTPCGLCRQFLAEFRVPVVYCARSEEDYIVMAAEELLPRAFGMDAEKGDK